MRTWRTTQCSRYGHPEILGLISGSGHEATLSRIMTGLENRVATGVKYAAGETIQIGCGELIFQAASDGALQLYEPDYLSFPIVYHAVLDHTVRQVDHQAEVLESLPERYFHLAQSPSIMHSAIVCSEFGKPNVGFLMKRERAQGNDSGWFIGCLTKHDHQDPRNLRLESLYRVLLTEEALGDFLHLPVGCAVQCFPGKGLIVYDENSEPIVVRADAPIRKRYPCMK